MTDLFTEQLITEITSAVWEAFLPAGDTIAPLQVPLAARSLTGSICISGTWNGVVALTCSSTAALRATASMLDLEMKQASLADVTDVMGELVNIVGGNIKGLLPPPTDLSLPMVTDGRLYVETRGAADLLVDAHLSWMGEPVDVAVWERHRPDPR